MNELKTFTFGSGSHKRREDGLCVMEAVSFLAGEEHSDHPACADPVITTLAIWLNDACDDKLRQELLQDLPWRIVGTKSTLEIEQRRGLMAADWAVRVVSPAWFRFADMEAEAVKLESIPEVKDAKSAFEATKYAKSAAKYAKSAAKSAMYAAKAAKSAFEATKSAVSGASLGTESAKSAMYAAWYAAESAFESAKSAEYTVYFAKYTATNLYIKRSTTALLDRMIRLTEPQEVVVIENSSLAKLNPTLTAKEPARCEIEIAGVLGTPLGNNC